MIAAIVQARMASQRLPGKSLMDISGKPVIQRVLERVSQIRIPGKVIAAIPTSRDCNDLYRVITDLGYKCVRGSEDDVLDRYHWVASGEGLDHIIRITADCPLLDPAVSTRVVHQYLTGGYDYVSNAHPATFPDGLDTEVFSFKSLCLAWEEGNKPYEREHVTPYIWGHPEGFRLGNVTHTEDLSHLRWTLDTPEDLEYVRYVYSKLPDYFRMEDILELPVQHHGSVAAARSCPASGVATASGGEVGTG